MSTTNPVLEAKHITKTFPGVKALDDVSLTLQRGEVHALVGENGAGKSTLMQILAGVYEKDEGHIEIDGVESFYFTKHGAEEAGVRIVFQESSLLQNLTILENLFNSDPPVNRFGLIDWKAMYRDGENLLARLSINLDLDIEVHGLSIATQKMIEIARALSKDFKILILDEPTASITVEETEQLFNLIRRLRESGKSIIYISHRIEEIRDIADRVTVLKDGKYIGTYKVNDITDEQICERMVGRELLNFNYHSWKQEPIALEVEHLSGVHFHDVSFSVRKGELFSITGLTGAGRSELALSLFGFHKTTSGRIYIDGIEKMFRSPEDAMKAGIGYVSEDRKRLGLFMNMSVSDNIESNNIDTHVRGMYLSNNRIEEMCRRNIKDFNIRCSGPEQIVHNLSGGNQQKVCLSRWFSFNPSILIVDEPTLGVDVGSKEEIYIKLNHLAEQGMTIIMISSDMIETMALGDRIMVMHSGKIMDIRDRSEYTEEAIVALASGIKYQGEYRG